MKRLKHNGKPQWEIIRVLMWDVRNLWKMFLGMMFSHLTLLQDLDYQLKLNGNMHIVRERQQHIMDLLELCLHNLMGLMILLINFLLFLLMVLKVKIQLV